MPQDGSVPVVAVGASAGGVTALTTLVEALPADFKAALLVVLHIAPTGPSLLPQILGRAGSLPAEHAENGDTVEAGRVYVAPPDMHLTLDGDTLVVQRSPRENGVRPSVDCLFRSVARSRGPLSLGIVLSGTLDDGTAGLIAISGSGGATIVQDPEEAVFPGMPASAARHANPQFVVPLDEIAPLVVKLVDELLDGGDDPETEGPVDREQETSQGRPSPFTCPECGGTLFEQAATEELLQFRCRVGHGFSGESLLVEKQAHLESALYAAIVALEERADLSRRLGDRMERRGKPELAGRYLEQAVDSEAHIRLVREAIARLSPGLTDEQ